MGVSYKGYGNVGRANAPNQSFGTVDLAMLPSKITDFTCLGLQRVANGCLASLKWIEVGRSRGAVPIGRHGQVMYVVAYKVRKPRSGVGVTRSWEVTYHKDLHP